MKNPELLRLPVKYQTICVGLHETHNIALPTNDTIGVCLILL